MENRIHLIIEKNELKEIQDAIKTLETKLTPHLKTLSVEERRKLPKMGEANEPFVEKVLEYTKSDPQFNPPYLKVDELLVDFESVKLMTSFIRPLTQIISQLDDSIMLAGSEAYAAARMYYKTIQNAVEANVQDAKIINDDLSKRYNGQGKKSGNGAPEVISNEEDSFED